MAEILVDETKVLQFLLEKVEPQSLQQILIYFQNQTTDAIKSKTVEEQLLDVLKISTQFGVIQEKNNYYFASTHVEDVLRILMEDNNWFIPSATPSEVTLGSTSQISVGGQISVHCLVPPNSAQSLLSTTSTLSNRSGMFTEATMLSTNQDDD